MGTLKLQLLHMAPVVWVVEMRTCCALGGPRVPCKAARAPLFQEPFPKITMDTRVKTECALARFCFIYSSITHISKISIKRMVSYICIMFCWFLKKILFIYFGQSGKEGEREGERHQCVVASRLPPIGDLARPTTQACALTGNRTINPLFHRPALNPLSHTSRGCFVVFFIAY